MNDPLGQAILDFSSNNFEPEIIVSSDLCDDDVIPVPYLFRTYAEMPKLEQVALNAVKGKTLDIGAAAGCHAKFLVDQGVDVTCIDTSKGAVKYLKENGFNAIEGDILNYTEAKYDTLLILMNGLGLAGSLNNLQPFLDHCKSLLAEGGQIICDSTDIIYLYEDEDGGLWLDLNAEYYGNFKFQMKYKSQATEWFDWLYIDLEKLEQYTAKSGLNLEVLYEEDYHYLVRLTLK